MNRFRASNGVMVHPHDLGWLAVVCNRPDVSGESTHELSPVEVDALREYFQQESSPKPWQSAVDGDIWMLRGADHPDEDRAYLAVGGRFFTIPPKSPIDLGWKPDAFASEFTSGERFWPDPIDAEVVDDA